MTSNLLVRTNFFQKGKGEISPKTPFVLFKEYNVGVERLLLYDYCIRKPIINYYTGLSSEYPIPRDKKVAILYPKTPIRRAGTII